LLRFRLRERLGRLLEGLRTWLFWSLAMSWDSLRLITSSLLGREYYFFSLTFMRQASFLICPLIARSV
jgi:hypothetical protein